MSEHDGRDQGTAWSRPDASMSLLSDLFSGRLLDPGYAEAAARRAQRAEQAGLATGPTANGPMAAGTAGTAGTGRRGTARRVIARLWRTGVPVVLALAGLLVVVAGTQVRRGEPAARRERSRLIAEIKDRTARTDELHRRMDGLRDETERLRATALARSDAGRQARAELTTASAAVAAAPESGRGIEIVLRDAKDPAKAGRDGPGPAGDGPAPGRVYDEDLQVLVNGLWASGATAIAVNDQRITATTAIRAAGEAILVDYRPLTTPYRVVALGDPNRLRDRLAASAAGARLRVLTTRFGIRSTIRTIGRTRLPAAGVVGPRYARQEMSR